MGNANSTEGLASKLRSVVPDISGHDMGVSSEDEKPFARDKDREQFIQAVIIVITQNGMRDLREYSFRLLYSRRDDGRIVARIVAEKDGVIRAKIEPDASGENQIEAFKALKKDVENKLDRILSELPGEERATKGESSGTTRSASKSGSLDQPPAYSNTGSETQQ